MNQVVNAVMRLWLTVVEVGDAFRVFYRSVV